MGRLRARKWSWDLGLGPQLGSVFWAMVGLEATYGAYSGIWPLWIETLGAPVAVVGLVLGSAGLLRLFVLLPSASLGERLPARTIILAARTVTMVGLVIAMLATHWTQLLAAVACNAIGEITFPIIQSYVAKHAADNRVRAFTLVFNVGPAVAFGLAPLVAGGAIALWGMRAAFALAIVFASFSLFWFSRMSGEREEPRAADAPSGSYRDAFALPGVARLLVLQFLTIFALSLGISLLPNYLADTRGFAPATIAILGGLGSFGSVLYGVAVTRSRKLQSHPYAAIALASCFVIATLAVCVVAQRQWPIILAFFGRGGLWSAWGLFVAGLSEVVGDTPHKARAFALSEMIGGTAFFSAPMLAGVLYDLGPATPLLASIGLAVAMLPVLVWSQRHHAPRPVAAPALIDPEIA